MPPTVLAGKNRERRKTATTAWGAIFVLAGVLLGGALFSLPRGVHAAPCTSGTVSFPGPNPASGSGGTQNITLTATWTWDTSSGCTPASAIIDFYSQQTGQVPTQDPSQTQQALTRQGINCTAQPCTVTLQVSAARICQIATQSGTCASTMQVFVGAFVSDASGNFISASTPLPFTFNAQTSGATATPGGGAATTPDAECGGFLAGFNALCITTRVVLFLTSLLIFVLGKLLSMAVGFLEGTLLLVNFTNVPIVNVGWTVVRNLVNLLFILILLVIGFATIFRKETYGLKALLPRLIVIALLVNFSKVIASVIIDAGNLITTFFYSNIGGAGGSGSLGTLLTDALNLNKVFDVSIQSATSAQRLGGTFESAFQLIFGAIAGVVVVAVAVVGILLTALVFIVRVVVLWMLIIFAPLGWVASILPGTRRFSSMWWDNFLKWVFVAPVMMFFLYLLVIMLSWKDPNSATCPNMTPLTCSLSNPAAQTTLSGMPSSFFSNAQYLLQYGIIMLLVLAGPFAAQSMGGMMGSGVISFARSAQRGFLRGVGRYTGKGAAAGARGAAGFVGRRAAERLAPRAQQIGESLAASRFGKTGLGRALTGGIARLGVRAGEVNRAQIEKEMKQFSNFSTKTVTTMLDTYSTLPGIANQNRFLAAAQVVAQRRDLADQDNKDLAYKGIERAITLGRARNDFETIKPLLAAMPNFAKDEKEKEKAVREATRTGAHKNWSEAALKDGSVIGLLYKELGENAGTLKKYGEDLGDKERTAFAEGLKSAFTTGDVEKDFDRINSDLREAFAYLKPERYLEAVIDSLGNESQKDFAKELSRKLGSEQLERFYGELLTKDGKTKSPEAQRTLEAFEKYRGTYKIDEVDKALRVSGQFEDYKKNLDTRLSSITAVNERFNDENTRRSEILGRLSGNLEKAFSNDVITLTSAKAMGTDWQKRAELATNTFVTSLREEEAEDFGKRANDHVSSRHAISQYALPHQLDRFVREMKQENRADVVRQAFALHNDPSDEKKYKTDKNYRNTVRREPYLVGILRLEGMDVGEQEWEWSDMGSPKPKTKRSGGGRRGRKPKP